MSPSGRLRFDLPSAERSGFVELDSPTHKVTGEVVSGMVMKEDEIKELQRQNIIAALKQSGGRIYGKKGAAKLLGVKPTTLTERMKAMGIEKRG